MCVCVCVCAREREGAREGQERGGQLILDVMDYLKKASSLAVS